MASAAFLRGEISGHLPLYEYHPGFPHTYVTTVYFDTRDRSFYRQAEQSYEDNIKLRVKEYSYRNREGAFLSFPQCFVELKQRTKGVVLKRRLRLAKADLGRLFRGQDLWPEAVELGDDRDLDCLRRVYEDLRAYLLRYQFHPTSIVNYRRSVYQKTERELRITFDDELAVFAARQDVYGDVEALTPETLGLPLRRYRKVILEIKCPSGRYPWWLQQALRNHCSKRLSKFTTSIRYLTGAMAEDSEDVLRGAEGGSDDLDDTQALPRRIEN